MPRAHLAALILLIAGCRAATPPPVAVAPAAPETVRQLPNDVHWVRNSAEYRAAMIQAYRLAGERLEELAEGLAAGTWAVALDADETVISNARYQKEIALRGESYSPESFGAWTARRAAPPLPGVLDFLARAEELGGRIAIVTNRRQPWCADTEENFRAYAIPFDVILCRRDERDKEPRWRQIEDGSAAPGLPPLRIVMWLGDNIEDFPDLGQEVRHAGNDAFAAFGGEYFVLPNPMYGSWEGNPRD